MKNTKIFQLNDSDNVSMGLLKTNLPEKTVTANWEPFYLSGDDDVDTFADYLNTLFPKSKSERLFIDAEINL